MESVISNKTLSKIIAERGGHGSDRFDAERQQQAQERRTARMLRLKSTVDARVKV